MAFKDFRARPDRDKRDEGGEAANTASPETMSTTTYLDEGCELTGTLAFREGVRIDGRVEGEIDCKKTVVVGETGKVHAAIRSESVVIHGQVEGDIAASRKITLHKSARVTGDMCTAGIVIEEGARVEGRILIGTETPAPTATPDPGAKTPPEGAPGSG